MSKTATLLRLCKHAAFLRGAKADIEKIANIDEAPPAYREGLGYYADEFKDNAQQLLKNPAGRVAESIKDMWEMKGHGPVGKTIFRALNFGLPALQVTEAIRNRKHRFQSLGSAIGGNLPFLLAPASKLSVMGGLGGSVLGTYLGGKIGGGIDSLLGGTPHNIHNGARVE